MTGIILDSVLMLLLVAALGYGVRLEKKLTALRAGQMAFAGAVTELNAAAGRAENALGALRDAAEEADMLHDRILKARAVKQELEVLCNRAATKNPSVSPLRSEPPPHASHGEETRRTVSSLPRSGGEGDREAVEGLRRGALRHDEVPHHASPDEDRALRMAALAERIQGMAPPKAAVAPGRDNVSAIIGALSAGRANHAAQPGPNRARVNLDDDLFAA